MPSSPRHTPIRLLDINGLNGRMAYLPGWRGKAAEILFVSGLHGTLERWRELMNQLRRYGTVTAADMPGLGGMTSFYAIGRPPTVDAYSDYLAALIKLRFKQKQLTIVAEGFGFVAATRLLQRYPAIAARVQLVVGIDGPANADDLMPPGWRRQFRRWGFQLASTRLSAMLLGVGLLHGWALPRLLQYSSSVRALDVSQRQAYIDIVAARWRQGDLRTYVRLSAEMLAFNNCVRRLAVPLYYIDTWRPKRARYAAEQRLKVIFPEVTYCVVPLKPAERVALTSQLASKYVPHSLHQLLAGH